MKMEQCSETSAYKIQTPGNYLEENIQDVQILYTGGSMCCAAKSFVFLAL